jgi:purine-binding chemotaxis protein CheW
MSEMKQFCTFYLGKSLLGIEVLKVQEVMQHQTTTEVPLAPPVIRGLMNLRGSIVSSVDLRRRFGMTQATAESDPVHIITHTPGGLISFQVDRIGEVVEVDDESFEVTPQNLNGPARQLIDGVYKLQNALLLVVNVERVLQMEGSVA